MNYLDHINRMVKSFVQEHPDINLYTYYDASDTVRIKMDAVKNSIERKIPYESLLSASGCFVVSRTLEEMYKEVT